MAKLVRGRKSRRLSLNLSSLSFIILCRKREEKTNFVVFSRIETFAFCPHCFFAIVVVDAAAVAGAAVVGRR